MTALENAARWKPNSGGFVRDEDQKIVNLSKPKLRKDRLSGRDGPVQCKVPRTAFPGAGSLSGP